jgi:predicted permease
MAGLAPLKTGETHPNLETFLSFIRLTSRRVGVSSEGDEMAKSGFGEAIWKDLRYGARLLRLNPGFAAVAVLSLALGIGANTAIFQLVDSIRLRTLPVKAPQELAILQIDDPHCCSGNFSSRYSSFTNPQWEQIRDHQQAFSSILAWSPERLNLAMGGEARYAEVIWISGDFFKTLGVNPFMGHLLSAADDQRGCGAPGADISYAFWQREYGGAPDALGKTLTLEGHPFEIVGITPPEFFGVEVGRRFDVVIPICSDPILHGENARLDVRRDWWLALMGRLKPGWTIDKATAELASISPGVFQETVPPNYNAQSAKYYAEYKVKAYPADSGFSRLRREYSSPLWMLLAIAGLVLIIACANLANLMLARASAREKEIAVRLAVGATRLRLMRQLLVESLLLAGLGTVFGALLAGGLSQFLVAFLSTEGDPLFVDLGTDWRILGFTAGLAVLTTVLFGLAPALRATRVAPGAVLKAAGRGMTAARERFGLRRILVVSQVALSLVLVVGALLFIRSLRNLETLNAGFQENGILVLNLDYTKLNIAQERRQLFNKEMRDRIAAIPGIETVSDARDVPVSGMSWNDMILSSGSDRKELGVTWMNRVSPGYFKTLSTPFLAGRDFDDHDTLTSPLVAIINESFAKKFLVGGNAVGQRFRVEAGAGEPEPFYEVVGLVGDTKYADLHDPIAPIAYFPDMQEKKPDQDDQIIVRSNSPLVSLISELKETIGKMDPKIDVDFHPFRATIEGSLLRDRLMATLSGFFGILAGLLAAIGLYGVISYSVARRRNEIGIRMALGAGRSDILRMVMVEAGIMLAVGAVIGTGLALALGQTAKSLLYGLHAYDPATITMAIGALAVVAAAASYLPAFRASRVDPMNALRDE